MARKIITGLDIGSSTVRAISVEKKKDGSLHIVAAAQKESEGIRKGYVTNLEEASKTISSAVKSLEKISGYPVRSVFISVGGISLGSARAKASIRTSTADGEITDNDIKRLVAQSEANLANLANKKVIHAIPLVFKVDNAIVYGRPKELKGTKLEVETLFITCLNLHLSDLIKTVEAAGLMVEDAVASPLATSCCSLSRQQKENGCVLANIGASTVSIVVFEDGLPISLEVFPIGSMHITNDIALGLQVPLDEAERIKLNYGSDAPGSKKKLADIIDARLSDIFDMIESHLKKINRNQVLPAGIILTGSGSNLFSIEEVARASLKLPAKTGAFMARGNNNLNITAPTTNLRDQILNDPGWSAALGLCVYAANEGSFVFDEGKAASPRKNALGSIKKWFHSLLP